MSGPQYPTGPGHVCFDATALIHYQDNGHLDLLNDLFPNGKFTPNVVTSFELVKSDWAASMNRAILSASWLESVPVAQPEDIESVRAILGAWGSRPRSRHDGEAETIVLCERYGWHAIMDDHTGRNTALDRRRATVSYMCSALLGAAAVGLGSFDVDRVWEIHCQVESRRKRPRLPNEGDFRRLVEFFRIVWQKNGKPPWPEFLSDPRLDEAVDLVDPTK